MGVSRYSTLSTMEYPSPGRENIFSTLETLDRRALIHMVQSIRVRGKKELDITFTHEDEYKKALQLLALAAQQKDYEQRKVG